MRVMAAAAAYWAAIFALGFVLGTVRVLWLAPLVGLLAATALELPVMLAASWWTAGRILRGFGVARGGAALLGQSLAAWLAGLTAPHALLGLAGQVGFALIPWWRARR